MLKNLKLFLPYIKKYRQPILRGALVLALVDLLGLSLVWILRSAIIAIKTSDSHYLLLCTGLYIGLAFLQAFFRYWMRIYFFGTSFNVARDLRNELIGHTQTLSMNFFNVTKTGDLMSRATNDIEAVRMFFANAIFLGLDIFYYLLIVPAVMFYLSSYLMLYIIIFLPLIPILVNRLGNEIHKKFKITQDTLSQISAQVQENAAGIRVIKSFAREASQLKSFQKTNRDYLTQNLSVGRLQSIFEPLLGLIMAISIFLVLSVGGLATINGKIAEEDIIAFIFYLNYLLWPMMGLGMVISTAQRAFASMQRLQEIFAVSPEIVSGARPFTSKSDSFIEFKNVSLVYHNSEKPALHRINLKIPAGSIVGILGPIGSGKTSLMHLLTRMVDPTEGEVLIDSVNIRNFSLTQLRSRIGYVPQDVFLFSESIAENIAFGLNGEEIIKDRIVEAAETAGIAQEIENLPDRYETMLGERGINLSGGQKQRLTLARALVKKPDLLILDDCFSSVDVQTEEKILNRISGILKGRTTLAISHRLPVIKLADLIIFMEDGSIKETGTHQELMKRQGHYAGFYQHQQIIEELEQL